LEKGARYDVVEAVLAAQGMNPARCAAAVRQLQAWVERTDWHSILPAFARCVRITRPIPEKYSVQPELFKENSERELWVALQKALNQPRQPGDVEDCLNAFLPMIPVINRFFDDVLVMAEVPALRQNRLGLLQKIASLTDGVADFSRLEGF
jgi:glycyl-tRNA synthetase